MRTVLVIFLCSALFDMGCGRTRIVTPIPADADVDGGDAGAETGAE